jgi:hypothetical protein
MGLFNLIFTLGVNRKPLDRGLTDAQKSFNSFASTIKGHLAGAFTAGTVIAFTKSIHDTVNRIKDLSEQFGVTTDEVQKTDHALKQSGLQFENLATALASMTKARRDAVEGNIELRQTFEKYGITLSALNSPQTRTYDILVQMSEAMAEGNLTARDQADLMDLLGPKALKLANVLAQLSKTSPPVLVRSEDVIAIDEAAKAYERMATAAKAIAARPLAAEFRNIEKGINAARTGDVGGMLKAMNPFSRIMDMVKTFVPDRERDASSATAREAEWVGPELPGGMWKPDADMKRTPMRALPWDNALSFQRPQDSLVSVGNFLGGDPSSALRGKMEEMQRQLQQIAANTKRTADNAVIIRK